MRGSMPVLSSDSAKSAAMDSLLHDRYAASTRGAQSSMWKTVLTALDKYALTPFPPTTEKVLALGAVLKVGGYSSAENYLSAYKVKCERMSYPFDATLLRTLADTIRSCKGGVGGLSVCL